MDYVGENSHKNDPARLVSPTVTATNEDGLCLTFWYHMYGDYVNELRVYVRQRDYESAPLWSRTGTQGQKWNYGQVRVFRLPSVEDSGIFLINKNSCLRH